MCTGAFVAMLLGLPHVWHIQEFGLEDHGLVFTFGQGYSVKLLGQLSASCIVLSNSLKSKFTAYIDRAKISVIYPPMIIAIEKNADSLTAFAASSKTFRCVIVGHLARGKRQEDAVEAIAGLSAMGTPVELVIVGGGDRFYRRHLENMVAEKKLQEARLLLPVTYLTPHLS